LRQKEENEREIKEEGREEESEIESNIEVLKLMINIERLTDRLAIHSKRLMLVLFETNILPQNEN
jgi:hypothetical protein